MLLLNNTGPNQSLKPVAQIGGLPIDKTRPVGQVIMGLIVAANVLLMSPIAEAAKPVVSIAKLKAIDEGVSVTLDGSASKDRDGDSLSYVWKQKKGTPVSITNANAAVASFKAPAIVKTDKVTKSIKLTFELTVSDATSSSKKSVVVTIKPVNSLPIAKAGSDRQVNWDTAKKGVSLDGSASSDDGKLVKYQWKLLTKTPKNTKVKLIDPKKVKASFTVATTDQSKPLPLEFELAVVDNDKKKSTAKVKITVSNAAIQSPVSNAGADQSVLSGVTVNLSGSQSNGSIDTYEWSQVDGDAVSLSSTNTVATSFTAPAVTSPKTFTFKLTTANSAGLSSDTVVITVNPAVPPVANAGVDQTVTIGNTVNLNGSQSTGLITSYQWTQVAGPAVTLSAANTATASFTAPTVTTPTELRFKLTTTNSAGSADDEVTITVSGGQDVDIQGLLSVEAPEVELNDPIKVVVKDLSGGVKPYTLVMDWGDGKKETIKLADDATSHDVEHYYAEEKSYAIKMTVVDANNQSRDFSASATIATLAECGK